MTSRDEPYLVLPFYRRGSLAGLIEDQGSVPWRGATYLLEQVAVTVTEVHGSGVVHRKIKPANILLTDFLLPRLADFDHSLAIGETIPLNTLPLSPFFSPGQAADANTAEPAEDVYALAAVLWALLAGESRFTISGTPTNAAFAAYEATALARQGRLPGDVTAPPQPILDLIARAMSDDLEQRPVDGAAFVTDLRHSVAEAERQRLARLPSLEPTSDPSSGTEIQTADDGRSTSPTDTAAREVRYVLMLVGFISVVILIMVAAATLAVG